MRTIKSRAWNKRSETMAKVVKMDWWGGVARYIWTEEDYVKVLCTEDLVLMMSTGLKDKNGKEIFEGDVLEPVDPSPREGNRVVEWGDGGFTYSENLTKKTCSNCTQRWPINSARAKLFEIIGNIYENPSLLK